MPPDHRPLPFGRSGPGRTKSGPTLAWRVGPFGVAGVLGVRAHVGRREGAGRGEREPLHLPGGAP